MVQTWRHIIIEKSGAFLKYNGETIGQGREAAKKLFKENPKLMAEIEQKVREKAAPAEEPKEAKKSDK